MRGLTTAASVWACAVIGILVGTSLYAPAVGLEDAINHFALKRRFYHSAGELFDFI
jgi:hypothetical protein